MFSLLLILILLQCVGILLILRHHQTSAKAIEKRSEKEVDSVMDKLVDQTIKNHEAKLNKVIEKITTETQEALQASMKHLLEKGELLFQEKITAMISELSNDEQKRLSALFEENALQLAQQSKTLVTEVAESSLKRHLTLQDHDLLARDALKKILLSKQPNN